MIRLREKLRAKMLFSVVNLEQMVNFCPKFEFNRKIFNFFFFGLSVVTWVLIYAKPPFKLKFLGKKAKTAPLIT